MKVKYWGVRGSIPAPSENTIKYGANTACIEIRNNNNEIIIIDAGTGIRELGKSLINEFKQNKLELLFLISHTHWDHIQGLPFFIPLYKEGINITIVAPEFTKKSLKEILEIQMDYDFFPLKLASVPSHIEFQQISEISFNYKNFKIQTKILNHGGLGAVMGYSILADNKRVVYVSDHEGYDLFFKSNSNQSKKIIDKMLMNYHKFIENADLLIHDSQYDDEDYLLKKGWGHSSFNYSLNKAISHNVKMLSFIHYDPDYSDERIDKIIDGCNKKIKEQNSNLKLLPAREGLEIEL
ncbi:MAG TPA: MBL fold metallo-hydrolase [bacterium]|nr:MBL fold metallo-hydrolase [bacterium]HOL47247.1 MBL fold metallo-hydrolase [bacterium]HPQ19283.1 MBL fold metallo-hydrolase [bacterium]